MKEFEGAPKEEPALLYSRLIPTRENTESFVAGYFNGQRTMPVLRDQKVGRMRPIPMMPRGSLETRARVLRIEANAQKADDGDPWFDVRYSYERYAARGLISVEDGFEETLWFISVGWVKVP